ncbi:MAG: hypothetical protein ACOYU2_00015 [Nitrospirota bacterium]
MNKLQVLEMQIRKELSKIKKLLSEAEEIKNKKASNANIRIGGSILHDFYTGTENIFHAIASSIDKSIPSGMSWHTELLNQMTLDIPEVRTHVISEDTAKLLDEYLRFRHLFRKRYGFDLEWTNIKKLLKKMPAVYTALERDINEAFEENK